jgi:poly(3-hydroxybutyrate) depolymerase
MFLHQLLLSFTISLLPFATPTPISTSTISQRDTTGCGISHPIGDIGITTYHEVPSGNRTRSYSIHLPSGYDMNHEYPVVIGFHGSSSIGLFFEVDTGLSLAKYSSDVSLPVRILIC